MKSYAHVKGHALHPALVPFPVAFLIGAFGADLIGWMLARPVWKFTAVHLLQAGIVMGLVAAVPGVLDFWKRVPPASSGRARAIRHGLANVLALVLFTVSLVLHYTRGLTILTLAIECVGAALLAYSGWLGGVLVTRNMMSVDHRFANAGKWQESRIDAARGKPVIVARADDLEPGQMKLLVINGHRIALARTEQRYVAFDDGCTHRGASLADGVCIGNSVQCLWHGSRFNMQSGAVECGPAKRKIRTHEVRREKDDIVLAAAP